MHCQNCGAPVQDSDKFCRFCGKSLAAPAPEDTAAAQTEQKSEQGDLFGFSQTEGAGQAPSAQNAQAGAPSAGTVPPAQPYGTTFYGKPYTSQNAAGQNAPLFELKVNKFGIAGFILSILAFILLVSAFVSVFSILMSDTSWMDNGGYFSESMLMEIGASFLAFSAFSLLCGVLGVCFSGVGKRNASMCKLNGFATAGLVIGSVTLGIIVLFYFFSFV